MSLVKVYSNQRFFSYLFVLGWGHSRIFLLRESWSSGIENFRDSVFLKSPGIGFSGIRYSRSGLLNFRDSRTTDKSWKFQKKFPKNFQKNFFFKIFKKKILLFSVFLFSVIEFSGFLNIFGIPGHIQYWAFLINPENFQVFFSK